MKIYKGSHRPSYFGCKLTKPPATSLRTSTLRQRPDGRNIHNEPRLGSLYDGDPAVVTNITTKTKTNKLNRYKPFIYYLTLKSKQMRRVWCLRTMYHSHRQRESHRPVRLRSRVVEPRWALKNRPVLLRPRL